MNKAEFIEKFQKNSGLASKAEAERALDGFIQTVKDALVKKEKITLVGLGTFSTVDVKEKTGKVPASDKTYTKPAHTAPKFSFGKGMKDAIANV